MRRGKVLWKVKCRLTLHDPMNFSLPGSSVYGIFQARILGWVAIFVLHVVFLTQGWDPGLSNCRQTLYPRSHHEVLTKRRQCT